jgi:peptide/nickel transport system permease protein
MHGGTPAHWLGTDTLGRDYLSRLIYGARIALLIGCGTVLLSGAFGITLGMLAGYYGGSIDLFALYLITVRLSLPLILVELAVVGLVGSALPTIMAVLARLLWDRFAVVTRTMTQQLRSREFVLLARAAGCSDAYILLREILPNVLPTLLVIATLEMAQAIVLEAALSFLGLGVRPPLASWGLMIAEGRELVFFEPWLVNLPGAALFILVAGLNLLGDGLQQRIRPEAA